MNNNPTLLRTAGIALGLAAASVLSVVAVHAGMSYGDGSVSVSAKGAPSVTHAPELATMQLGRTVNEAPMPETTTTTPSR